MFTSFVAGNWATYCTVDYVIASHDLFASIEGFIVKQPNIFPDHSQIVCWTKIGMSNFDNKNQSQHQDKINLPKQYIWNEISATKFKAEFESDNILSRLMLFENTTFELNSEGIEQATIQFRSIMEEAAKRSLELSCQKNSKRKHSTQQWFDNECKTLRISLKRLSNKKHRNPLDTEIRKEYHLQNKTFKKLLKYKERLFFDSKINELVNNKNNDKFWDTLKSMNENNISASNSNNEAPTEKLYDHFKNLHLAPEHTTLSTFHLNVLEEKKRLEKAKNLQSELDDPIPTEEIDKAIKKLKNKKAPGLDRMRNEMLKTSLRFIRASLTKLFTLILKSGAFPTLWSDGIITALHKSGNKDDPSNYRGICISSCLGKLFCSILNNRLLNFSQKHKIIHRSQIGFLPGHRTSDHIFTLKT